MRAALLCAAALLVPALASSGRAHDDTGATPAVGTTGAARPGAAGAKGAKGAQDASADAFEHLLVSVIQPDSVARWARGLAARSHVAGTPGQRATRDSIVAWMSAAGLTVAYDSLEIYLPQPLEIELRQTAPTTHLFDLAEPALGSRSYEDVPAFNAYGAGGVAEGVVVYTNFGLPEDYEQLAALGIDVEGRIVLARYGRSFRGIKAREAEIRGAAGLLLFSDPSADGFTRGTVLPEGPYRPERGLQRGSVLNSNGDPSTPGRPSLPGAARVPEAEMEGIARIPVLPIGYGAAARLLAPLGGPPTPDGWAGGLDVSYRPGPGPTAVRMTVRTETGEAAYHPAFNTIAALPGAVWPDEWIIIGAHRDAWGPGAVDNVSGTASVVEVARAFARAARDGLRPRRTIVFATWDAEEWGILGSTEWVEANEERLTRSAVAYINQDSPVSGDRFGGSAAPEIRAVVREATRAILDPTTGRSVYEVWLAEQRSAGDGTPIDRPTLGTMGGGSDHLPFYVHLGIPAAGYGFGGASGVYHSMYDTSEWMERFGDPGYEYHAATARLTAVIAARLANADVVPYSHAALIAAYRTELAGFATEFVRTGSGARASVDSALARVRVGLERYDRTARQFSEAVSRSSVEDPAALARVNEAQRATLQALLRPDTDPETWSRNLYVRDDPDNGYSPVLLPGVRLALRAGDIASVVSELDLLGEAFATAADRLRDAIAALAPADPAP